MYLILIIIFLFGAVVGSFLNVLVFRKINNKKITGRSACPKCKKKILWYQNIPILSYFYLKGKCASCGKKISWQYPAVEFVTGIAFLFVSVFSKEGRYIQEILTDLSYRNIQLGSESWIFIMRLFLMLIITSLFILIATYDLGTKEIPNGYNLTFVLLACAYTIASSIDSPEPASYLSQHLASGLFIFICFWSLVYFSREALMGGGDAKFVLGIGFLLGPASTLGAIIIASVFGSFYGVILMALKKATPKSEVPFGPFLSLGAFTFLIFGEQLVSWYAKIFLGF